MRIPRARVLPAALLALITVLATLSVAVAEDAHPGRGLAKGYARDVVIVGFKDGAGSARRVGAAGAVEASAVRRVSPLANDTVVMKLPPGQSVESAIAELQAQPGVAFAEPDYYVYAAQTSNDTYYQNMWGMHGPSSTPRNQYGSNAAGAWAAGNVGRSDVYVAVLDEGIETSHADLGPNIDVGRGWDFLSDDGSVYDGSAYGHGTHVAGTIGARGGNGLGVVGVNWRVKMISVKMLGPEANSGAVSETIAAIDYVTSLKQGGVNIVAINASWGYEGPPSSALLAAIQRAGDAGLLFVAAAGNEGKDIDRTTFYPAAYDCSQTAASRPRGWDCLITVANLTSGGGRAGDSNYGSVGVDLGAPGSGILSAFSGGYAYASGTSMAAPHVTGAVALCSSIDPAASPATIRNHVLSTTVPTPSMSATTTGGRLDVGAMAAACAGAPSPTPTPTPSPTPTPTPSPTPTPDVSTVVVDDLSNRFVRKGGGWRAAAFGYAGHHFWSSTRSSSAARIAKWKAELDAPGQYRIKAKVPTRHASTRSAVYYVKTADGWVKRVRNQYKRRGDWVSLGVHRLTAAPVVKLTDRTGEPPSRGRAVAFDAVKFVPVAAAAASRPTAPPILVKRPASTPAPSPIERTRPGSESMPSPKDTPKQKLDLEPAPAPDVDPRDEATPDPDDEPRLRVEPKPKPKTKADRESKPKPEPKPTAKPDREARPATAPAGQAAPAGVLVVEPTDVQLDVGARQRVRAFVCPERQAVADVEKDCVRASDVEWALGDPAAGKLAHRGSDPKEGKPQQTVLIAMAPAETWLAARSGSLEARTRLIIDAPAE